MCKCKYAVYYEEKTLKEYRCDRPHVDNSDYCIFHDRNYWRDHEDEVREEFYKLVKDAIASHKPLYCIGFNLPAFRLYNIKGLDKLEFREPVYFSYAKFYKEAHFSFVRFYQPVYILLV